MMSLSSRHILRTIALLPGRSRFGTSRQMQSNALEHFYYSKVIVSGVPTSFASKSIRKHEPSEPIDLVKARYEHANYVMQISKLIKDVVYMQEDENYPDCVFVEDPAVVFDGTALIMKLGHPSRVGESQNMKGVLESLDLHIVELSDVSPTATMDGGDVLFTGKEFLIGLSSRTNQEGIKAFAKVFHNHPVTVVQSETLHLKSMCSMAGVGVIAIGDTPAGRQARNEIEQKAQFKYDYLTFPDDGAANCLFINGVVLHATPDEYPRSYHVWYNYDKYPKIELPNSEMAKAGGLLTCSSIRMN